MFVIKYFFVILLIFYIFILDFKNDNAKKEENIILISFFDSYIWKEFLYFYNYSIKSNKIFNFLSYSYDKAGLDLCIKNNIKCEICITRNSVKLLSQNTYQSKGFLERMFIRNEVIMRLLRKGISLIISDIDIIFLKNPIGYVTTGNYDISTTLGDNNGVFNGGF